jgi:hypothetical protein
MTVAFVFQGANALYHNHAPYVLVSSQDTWTVIALDAVNCLLHNDSSQDARHSLVFTGGLGGSEVVCAGGKLPLPFAACSTFECVAVIRAFFNSRVSLRHVDATRCSCNSWALV